jgi:pyroglutamyl-peptidase
MKLLIYAFDPFKGEKINSSQEVLKKLRNDNKLKNADIEWLLLPTSFQKASTLIIKMLKKYSPDIVLGLGQKEGIDFLKVERVALNLADSKNKDNSNYNPKNKIIDKNGPAAYFTSLPNIEIVRKINKSGIKTKMSLSAGTFVCNYVIYTLLNYVSQKNLNCKIGFIHIPKTQLQVKDNKEMYMDLNESSEGIKRVIDILMKTL